MSNIKPIFRYVDNADRIKFKDSQCLLTISVGQQTHEDERFSATMDLINSSFSACVLLIDDSLQRHTMALNRSEDAEFFYKISIKEGDLWLDRNEKYYNKLTIPKKIIRWDRWLNHPEFHSKQCEIMKEINNDSIYKEAFDNSIDEFLGKYCERLSDSKKFDIIKARQLCFDFVLEEGTALSLWPELGCHYEVYPNLHNAAIEETRKRFVLSKYPDLLRGVTIGFRNAKQLKPQRFVYLQDV